MNAVGAGEQITFISFKQIRAGIQNLQIKTNMDQDFFVEDKIDFRSWDSGGDELGKFTGTLATK